MIKKNSIKVIIAGSRDFKDFKLLCNICDSVFKEYASVTVVSGAANGADKLGESYARMRGLQLEIYPADWNKYGNSAGYHRNLKMAQTSDALIAFWDGYSKGTKMMIQLAKQYKLFIKIHNYLEPEIFE